MMLEQKNILFLSRKEIWQYIVNNKGNSNVYVFVKLSNSTKDTILRKFARYLYFPYYFADNWDSFEECINDLTWLQADVSVNIINFFDETAKIEENNAVYLDILMCASRKWASEDSRVFKLIFDQIIKNDKKFIKLAMNKNIDSK
ncbi:barstar family protein [Acetobacter indonesiensis]